MSRLPVQAAHTLPSMPVTNRWLIDELWCADAVGILGGEPKCCKSFLALDMAVAVASGRPCLGHFSVIQSGRVLLYAAEDALHVVRSRLEAIAGRAGIELVNLDIQVITAPSLRIDQPIPREQLRQMVAELRPRLLVLDPFVRLHRIDENASAEVAPLLGYLRELQRDYGVAVVLVHHSKKSAGRIRHGQALRGSSEFHAWGDSNLYLRRMDDELLLSIEHRAAPAISSVRLTLRPSAPSAALAVLSPFAPQPSIETSTKSPVERIEAVLSTQNEPLSLNALRTACRMRKQAVYAALHTLCESGRVTKTKDGFILRS